MFLFENSIDKLVKKVAKLKVKRQKVLDKKDATNSKLGIKRKGLEDKIQILENQSLVIQNNADNLTAEIDRQIKKTNDQIKIEKDYCNSIGENVEGEYEKLCCHYGVLKRGNNGVKPSNRACKE